MSNRALTWAFDQQLPPTTKFVLVALADFADESWSCYPSQATLAQMTGLGVRTVRRAVADLESRGFLVTENRHTERGWRTSDRFVLRPSTVQPANLAAGVSDDSEQSKRPLWPVQPAAVAGPTGHSGRSKRPMTTVQPATLAGHKEEPSVEPSVEPSLNDLFDQFWSVYPRHVAKAAALAMFEKLEKRGVDLEAVVDGARRFAKDPNLPEARFIPHPTTWLNQGRWEDDPLPKLEADGPVSADESVLTAERAHRDRWLSERGITLDEYRDHYEEPGWLEAVESRVAERIRV